MTVFEDKQRVSWNGHDGIVLRTGVLGLSKTKSVLILFDNKTRKILIDEEINKIVKL